MLKELSNSHCTGFSSLLVVSLSNRASRLIILRKLMDWLLDTVPIRGLITKSLDWFGQSSYRRVHEQQTMDPVLSSSFSSEPVNSSSSDLLCGSLVMDGFTFFTYSVFSENIPSFEFGNFTASFKIFFTLVLSSRLGTLSIDDDLCFVGLSF